MIGRSFLFEELTELSLLGVFISNEWKFNTLRLKFTTQNNINWDQTNQCNFKIYPDGRNCRIHWLLLCNGLRAPPANECLEYHTKQTDGEIPVMLELWGMWNTSLLPLLSGPFCPGVFAPDRVLSIGQIELNCVLMVNWMAWNRTVLTFKLRT